MRKSKIKLIFLAFILNSCNEIENKVTLFSNSKGYTYNFELYEYKKAQYILIDDKKAIRILENRIIDSLTLSTNGKISKGKPIYVLSSKFEESDYLFPVNKDGKVDLVVIDGKKMFTVVNLKKLY
jgi:hypothetical protein